MTAAARPSERKDSIGRFIAGDPLRALAALAVLFFHTTHAVMGQLHVPFPDKAYGSFVGFFVTNSANVIFIFFCGSGYLLGRPFVRAFVLNRRGPRIADFARNRAARILPPCLIAITVILLVRGIGDSSFTQVLAVYGLVQNYVSSQAQENVIHIWSVDVEALYYILLPICALALARAFRGRGTRETRLAVILGILLALIVASVGWRAIHVEDVLWQRRLPSLMFAIAVGMALGALEIPGVAWASRLRRPAVIGGSMFFAGWAVLLLTPFTAAGPGDLKRGIAATIGCALVMGGPLVQQWGGAGALRLLDNRVLHAIGRWSYSIYLFHILVLYELQQHVHATTPKREVALIIVPVALGSIALGALSFQFIEKPMMRFRGISTQPTARPRHDPPNLPADVAPGSEPPVEPAASRA